MHGVVAFEITRRHPPRLCPLLAGEAFGDELVEGLIVAFPCLQCLPDRIGAIAPTADAFQLAVQRSPRVAAHVDDLYAATAHDLEGRVRLAMYELRAQFNRNAVMLGIDASADA